MEDILASIRRILSEDEVAAGACSGAAGAAVEPERDRSAATCWCWTRPMMVPETAADGSCRPAPDAAARAPPSAQAPAGR